MVVFGKLFPPYFVAGQKRFDSLVVWTGILITVAERESCEYSMERWAVQKQSWPVGASTHTWNDLYFPVWQYIYSLYMFVYLQTYIYIYTYTYAYICNNHIASWKYILKNPYDVYDSRWAVFSSKAVLSAVPRRHLPLSFYLKAWSLKTSGLMVAMYQWYSIHPLKERLMAQDRSWWILLPKVTYSVCSSSSR